MRVLLTGAALVALAAFTPASAGTIRLCTGTANGNYAAVGEMIAGFRSGGTTIKVVKDTGGTWGNIQRTFNSAPDAADACDAMIGQPDGAVVLKRSNPSLAGKMRKIGMLHREYLHVICAKESGVTSLEDLAADPKKYSIALGAEGSGADLIWQNFIAEDSSYEPIPVVRQGGVEALSSISTNSVTCGLFPAGLGNGDMHEADEMFPGQLVLVQAQDKDFNDALDADGKPLYTWSKIPSGTYPTSLQSGYFTSVPTISWLAAVYVNSDRVTDKTDLVVLIRAVAQAAKQARAQFGD